MAKKPLTEFFTKPIPAQEADKDGLLQQTIGNIKQLGTGIKEAIVKRGEKVAEGFEAESLGKQTTAESILQTTGQTLGAAFDIGFEGLKAAARQLSAFTPDVIEKPVVDKVKATLTESPIVRAGLEALNKGAEFYETWKQENPRFARNLESGLNIVGALAGAKTVEGVAGLAEEAGGAIIKGGKDFGGGAVRIAKNTADDALKAGQNLRKDVQLFVAEKAVGPQLKTSAERLFLKGTKRLEDPVTTYDKFLEQTKKSLGDIKQDPAIAVVGDRMGDAFNKVVSQRRAVGKVMGEELKKVGGVKTDIAEIRKGFKQELLDSDLRFDGTDLIGGKASKMTREDLDLVEQYLVELNRLSSKPTIAQVDALISRTQGLVSNFKSAKNIVETTNGERLIKGNLNKLRETFDPVKTGNKALAKYAQARKAYAELSDFVDEGAGFLGKITQSGDFAKDASIAKSAVQSVLNNGKKDWLIRLEALTDYPALDEAVLALQAMKDAGDFRGVSLLQILSEGAVPTSKAGWVQKLIDLGIEKGTRIVAGTPEQQTRAILSDLASQARKGALKMPPK